MELHEVDEMLVKYVRPQSDPLAVRLLASADELPEATKMPLRDMKIRITLCQALSMSRRYGWTIAMGEEDLICLYGALALGFLPAKPGLLDGSFDESHGYMTKEMAAARYQSMPRLEYGKYKYMVSCPIRSATFEPHLLLVWGNPAQIARLIQGRVYETSELLTSTSMGGLACTRMITEPLLTDECTFVVAGTGERFFGLTQDHEMAFVMPWSKVEITVNGLKKTHYSVGWRYPTPSYLRFEIQFPQNYPDIMAYLREKD